VREYGLHFPQKPTLGQNTREVQQNYLDERNTKNIFWKCFSLTSSLQLQNVRQSLHPWALDLI